MLHASIIAIDTTITAMAADSLDQIGSIRAAGLDGLTPHALRHTAASLAIAAGANVKVVQTMLGHKSATMTLDLYGHLFAADHLRTNGADVHPIAREKNVAAQ